MKIAITSSNKEEISGNADFCLNYWIYTIENKKVIHKEYITLKKGQELYNVFTNKLIEVFVHPIFETSMLLTNNISSLTTDRLKAKKTVAFIIDELNINTAIDKLIQGTLQGHMAEEYNCSCGQKH